MREEAPIVGASSWTGKYESMKRLLQLLLIALYLPMLSLAMPPAAYADQSAGTASLETLAATIAAKTDARVDELLPRIDGVGGRLLALRSYLRSGDHLSERWSWTQEQIAGYEGSVEQQELNAEVQRVREAFEQLNPGYELFVNPQVRSLDIQLASWNRNESVAAASARLVQDAIAHLGTASGDAVRADMLEAFLRSYAPEPVPTVAAPGLSPHGQMRAIDFQVHRGAEIVAGPDTQTIGSTWEQGGWAARLDTAVREASQKFIGPLVSPREPWHYTYTPVAVADQ
ncbi:MAG: hypothetical protein NTU56_12785 [Proteobacteria bacterium]|nr:hypothetical protein [Pseudomonadota bacterium]